MEIRRLSAYNYNNLTGINNADSSSAAKEKLVEKILTHETTFRSKATTGKLLWKIDMSAQDTNLFVEEKTIYIQNFSSIHAFDKNGQKKWVWGSPGARGSCFDLRRCFKGKLKTFLVESKAAGLVVVDNRSGKEKFQFNPRGARDFAVHPAMGDDGAIFIGYSFGSLIPGRRNIILFALDSKGKVKWKKKVTSLFESKDKNKPLRKFQALIDKNDNVCIVVDNMLCSYDSNGKLRWKRVFPGKIVNQPYLDKNGNVYLVCGGGARTLFKVSSSNEIVWKQKVLERDHYLGPLIESPDGRIWLDKPIMSLMDVHRVAYDSKAGTPKKLFPKIISKINLGGPYDYVHIYEWGRLKNFPFRRTAAHYSKSSWPGAGTISAADFVKSAVDEDGVIYFLGSHYDLYAVDPNFSPPEKIRGRADEAGIKNDRLEIKRNADSVKIGGITIKRNKRWQKFGL